MRIQQQLMRSTPIQRFVREKIKARKRNRRRISSNAASNREQINVCIRVDDIRKFTIFRRFLLSKYGRSSEVQILWTIISIEKCTEKTWNNPPLHEKKIIKWIEKLAWSDFSISNPGKQELGNKNCKASEASRTINQSYSNIDFWIPNKNADFVDWLNS